MATSIAVSLPAAARGGKHPIQPDKIGEIGTPNAVEGNYPLGWAQAANTPFKHWKSDANSEGGTRNPLIISYPKGIKEGGGIRTQYGHVIDILPTTLELTGINAPEQIKGIKQGCIEGTSLAYSIADAKAASRHRVAALLHLRLSLHL